LTTALIALACTGCPPAPVSTVVTTSTAPLPVLTGSSRDPLRLRLEAAIDMVIARKLELAHGFWTVFHGILGLGPAIDMGLPNGQTVKALDYIRNGGAMQGLQFIKTPNGLDVFTAAQTGQFFAQGHQDQFVAEMAQWNVSLDLPFKVDGADYKFSDFVRYIKARASTTRKQELAWTIHVVGEYDGTDAAWTNQFGEKLTLEDLIRYEVNCPMDAEQSIRQGLPPLACGGTHRLFGLSWVLHLHQKKGGPLTGVWKDTQDHLNALKASAKAYQNPDGSFSTNWFSGKGDQPDPALRLASTGHIFEWLALELSDQELEEPWVERAVEYLCELFFETQRQPVEGGALYHAVHGLTIYHARRFGTAKLGPYTPYVHLAPGCRPVQRP